MSLPASKRSGDPHAESRRGQKEHGAQSDQGGGPSKPSDAPEPRPQAYEGPEESNQQRRYEK